MNKFFDITYSPEGCMPGGRTDVVMIWANNMMSAIKEFEKTKIDGILYSQYAIVKVEDKNK